MLQLAKVRLRKPTRISTFLVRDIVLDNGDACIVRTDRGLEYGFCVVAPADCPEDEAGAYSSTTVLRKATYNDENNFKQLLVDEEKAKALCTGKIMDRRLPMRLVNVEYTFDRHKVVFYFTADDRVDFRELVRDLAHELKTRIELRHIQVRDKSKLVGGLAACGRELCCATWLADFMPISMKMAKRQNLSLNPGKISGQCGRLMCCLGYEDYHYCDRKKQKPAGIEAPEKAEPLPADWEAEAAEAEVAEAEALLAEDEDMDFAEESAGPGETVYVVDPILGEVVNEPLKTGGAPPDASQKPNQARRRPRRRKRHDKS
jgi:cell fate regulator YaaT (PSP1 superfamily)